MEKFKLADFKVSSIRIDDMLNVMGGKVVVIPIMILVLVVV